MKPIIKFSVFVLLMGGIVFISCSKTNPANNISYNYQVPPPPPGNVSSNELILIQDWEIDPVNNIVSMVLLPVGFSIDSLLRVYLEVYEMLIPEWIEIRKNGTEPNRVFYKIENNKVILYVINPGYLAFINVNRTVKLVFS